jgi:hypothetical protein
MATTDQKGSVLGLRGTPDRANDYVYVWNGSTPYRSSVNNELGITGTPVGTTDSQTLTNKTFTGPTITAPVLSGTITGTYTLGGTPTFPASVVTLTGSQTLTNKILTSPTISSPTITNASITADSISGFTTANTGTIYGIPVTLGKLSGASIANSTVGPNQLATTAQNASVVTSETTTSTTYADLTTTTDSVSVTIGVNGLAFVSLQSFAANTTANAKSYVSLVASGANTLAASDAIGMEVQAYAAGAEIQMGTSFMLSGLTPGVTVFKMKYRVDTGGSGAGTGTFKNRRISVIPL